MEQFKDRVQEKFKHEPIKEAVQEYDFQEVHV